MMTWKSFARAGTAFALAVLAACGSSSHSASKAIGGAPGGLPPADDRLEPGLQGQVPLLAQFTGMSAAGYHKGLRLVGQNTIKARGSNFDLAWIGDCAYVTTSSLSQAFGISPNPSGLSLNNPLNGMAVIDAADATNPKLVDILQSPAMVAPHESMRASETRKIIVATRVNGDKLDVYDASDCRHPVLKSTTTLSGFGGHAGCLSADGMMAYFTNSYAGQLGTVVVNLSDLSHPKVVGNTGNDYIHDCGLNQDGTRLYAAAQGPPKPNQPNGLVIFDTTDFLHGASEPKLKQIGSLMWTASSENEMSVNIGSGSHTAQLFRNNGHAYIYSNDETPLIIDCPWSHGRIIDITDETHPIKVSDLTLEVQKAENCRSVVQDLANYSPHYVGFDDPEHATILFETAYAAGLRVWDIHDPKHPKEIAYWHPAPIERTALHSTASWAALSGGSLWDSVPNYVRYRPESGQIWIIGYTAGFQILQFTQSAGPTAPLPLGKQG